MKNVVILSVFAFIFLFSSCKKDEIIIPPDPIEDEYSSATFNFNFDEVDPKVMPIFDAYMQTYESAVNQDNWNYNSEYSLKNLNTIIFAYDSDNQNYEAIYMIDPPNGNYTGDDSNVFSTSSTASDGAKIIRVTDTNFLKELIKVRLSGSSFGISKVNDKDFLYFFYDKSKYDKVLQPLDIMRAVGFFIHEGFHLVSQVNFTQPNNEHSSIRFNLPADYPADSVSFSLIAAGMKMYEDILFEDVQNMDDYMKMYYILFKKLKELDTSGKNYIDGYYLFECWLEGSAEFTEYYMNRGSGVMNGDNQEIRYDNSLQEFKDLITDEIDAGVPPTINYNGQDRVAYYAVAVETTYYKLGSATLFILDNLGVDVYQKLKTGENPYEMLEEYINANNISINENEVYNNLKSQIDWEATKTMMQDYINLFN